MKEEITDYEVIKSSFESIRDIASRMRVTNESATIKVKAMEAIEYMEQYIKQKWHGK